jgi:hypothetical protein
MFKGIIGSCLLLSIRILVEGQRDQNIRARYRGKKNTVKAAG